MEAKRLTTLRRLTSLHIDGNLDDSGLAELESLLLSDVEAQSEYVKLMTIHSDLTLLPSFTDLNTSGPTKIPSAPAEQSNSNPARTPWLAYIATAVAVSACVLLAAILVPQYFASGSKSMSTNERGQEIVARIARKIDCDWEGDRWEIDSSSNIHAGQTLIMRRGLMELEFTSGAIVTLEGPVAFTVESPMSGFLSQGKLTTYVPESAHGFSVDTPGTQTVDLGTEFGLFVGEDGITETHVFDGEVIVKPAFTGEEQQEIFLSDDMAIRTEGNKEQTVSTLAAVPSRFAHSRFENDNAIPKPVVDRNLALWFSAEHHVQVDEENRVRAWGDIQSDSNKKSEVAWQVDETKRPLLVENAIGEKPAIRFSKKSLLVTEPVELDGEQTIGAVFRIDRNSMEAQGIPPQNGRQLINLNGPPHLSLRINDRFQLTSQNFAGTKKTKKGKTSYLTVGRLKHQEELNKEAVVVLSVYNSTKNVSQLFINGIRVDQAKAPPMKTTKSPRYLGSHMFLPKTNFLGDIAELFVYDTALTKAEISSISQSLIEKYEIVVNETQIGDKEKLDQRTKAPTMEKVTEEKKSKFDKQDGTHLK